MMAEASTHLVTAAEWAEVILGHDGPWTAFAIDKDGARHTKLITSPSDINEARLQHVDVWVGMARLRDDFQVINNRRGNVSDCESIKSLWLDIDIAGPGHKTEHALAKDIDDCMRLIATMEHPPTCIVHTGGGLHAYWSLVESIERDEAQTLLARWGEHWQAMGDELGIHVDSVFDITRILRIPNTRNHKTDTPRAVVVIEWSPECVYNPSDLEDHLTKRAPKESPTRTTAPVAGYIGPKRPGDHFAAVTTCAEVLAADGWTLDRTGSNGNQEWRRPGKERRQGTSATVYAADGRCVIWTDAMSEVKPRESLNPYRLYVKLNHGGDFSAGSKALAALGYGERHDPQTFNAPPPKQEAEPEAWEPPIPLGMSRGLMAFPVDVFPGWIRDHVEAAAKDIQVPNDLTATFALSVLAAACSKKAVVLMGSRRQHMNLYLAVALPPSTGKSPAYTAMVDCLVQFERELVDAAEEGVRDAERQKRALDRKAKDAETRLDFDLARECEMEALKLNTTMPKLRVGDITPEALVQQLSLQGGRLSMITPEGGVFRMMLGRYSDKVSLDEYLHAWAGEDIRVDRKGSGTLDVREAVLNIGVSIQPLVLQKLADPELQGLGLAARFMFSTPASLVGLRDYLTTHDEDPAVKATYNERMKSLMRTMYANETPGSWMVTPTARRMHAEWVQAFEVRRGENGDLKAMAEWLGKLELCVLRVAGLLAVAHTGRSGGEINDELMRMAIRLGDYWMDHAKSVHDMWNADPDMAKAKSVLAWLVDTGEKKFTVRDLHNARYSLFRKVDELVPVLQILSERGWIRPLFDGPLIVGKRGAPSPEFEVHPDVKSPLRGDMATKTRDMNDMSSELVNSEPELSIMSRGNKEPISSSSSSFNNHSGEEVSISRNHATRSTTSWELEEEPISRNHATWSTTSNDDWGLF